MYVAGRPHPNRRPARQFLARLQNREVDGCTSAEVLQEILHRYTGLGRPAVAKQGYDLFLGALVQKEVHELVKFL